MVGGVALVGGAGAPRPLPAAGRPPWRKEKASFRSNLGARVSAGARGFLLVLAEGPAEIAPKQQAPEPPPFFFFLRNA